MYKETIIDFRRKKGSTSCFAIKGAGVELDWLFSVLEYCHPQLSVMGKQLHLYCYYRCHVRVQFWDRLRT